MARWARVVDSGNQFRTPDEEAAEALADLRVLLYKCSLKDSRCTERQQAHHRAHLETLGLAIRQAQHIVEEPVLLIPHARILTHMNHRRGNPQEMFGELDGHVYIGRIGHGAFRDDLEHVQTEQPHPSSAVRLLQVPTGRQWRTAVEDADVVQAQEAPLEDVLASTVFAVDPPGKIEHQLLEDAFEPQEVALALVALL